MLLRFGDVYDGHTLSAFLLSYSVPMHYKRRLSRHSGLQSTFASRSPCNGTLPHDF